MVQKKLLTKCENDLASGGKTSNCCRQVSRNTDDRSKDCAQRSDNCTPISEHDNESQKVQFATIITEEAKVEVERAREEQLLYRE